MKTFEAFRAPAKGKTVWKKKYKNVPTEIIKGTKGFTAMIDGDPLDTFRSEKDAKKAIELTIKELL